MKFDEFQNLIRNKSVALVGPAKYMEGSGLGPEIDAHDIVIRVNRGIDSIEDHSEDIGSKTNVLYSCLISTRQHGGTIELERFKKHNIELIIAPPDSDFRGRSRKKQFHGMVDRNKVAQISKEIPVEIADPKFHDRLAVKVNCKPNTGYMAIQHLLSLEPNSLSIYGFSFYLDGFIEGQKSGVEKEKGCTEQEFADMAFNSKRHIQVNMWRHAKNTLLNNDRVFLDPTLKTILELDTFSREAFREAS